MGTAPSPAEPGPAGPGGGRPEAGEIRGGTVGTVVIAISVGIGVVLTGVGVAGRFDRAPSVALTAVLFVLPFLFVALMAWVFAVWCALPDRRSPPAVLAVLLVGMGGVWGPSVSAWTTDPGADDVVVRVMSWNLRRLWGGPDDGGDAQRCAIEAIRSENPDVLALQEVSAENVGMLERSLGLTCVHGTYLEGGGPRRGGLAACVRDASSASLLEGAVLRFVDDEDWSYVRSEVEVDGRRLNLLAVHLTPYHTPFGRNTRPAEEAAAAERTARGQANQSAALLDRVTRFRDPTVVAGDFNSTRDFYLHAALRDHLTDVWEVGGVGVGATKMGLDWLPLRIDYIYASPGFGVAGTRVAAPGCSDHRAVVTDLVLP